MKKRSGDFLATLRNWVVPETRIAPVSITNNDILRELEECFEGSCRTESVGASLVFNMHFIVILHPDVYEQRLPSLPIVVKEAVKMFYKQLQHHKKYYEELSPVSSLWQFKFGPATDFNGEKISTHDMRVIGMLTGLRTNNAAADMQQATKVTMKSKATNVFDKMDLNLDVLRLIHFAENGNFTVKFNNDLSLTNSNNNNTASQAKPTRKLNKGIARISFFMGDTNKSGEYMMKDTEIVIARKEPDNQGYSNYLLIDSPYVSNPHARIRFNENNGRYQVASFSANETRVNEVMMEKSDAQNPRWVDLAPESQLLLNGIITLHFKQQF